MNHCKPSELKDFAIRILLGTSLEDKLAPLSESVLQGTAEPFDPEGLSLPDLPNRPAELELSRHAKKRQTHQFPTKNELSQNRSRGHVLHFFANHELLALELMALAILKFSDAPTGFIRGIVQTMADEQRHMHRYLDRMKELGVEFGEAPLNGFFWQSLKDMKDPQEYAAAMSLTFEQANLDFSLYFEQDFRRLGDHVTAQILNEVRKDEIGHVKHGAIWLDRWRDPAKSLWDDYMSHLRFPMTPARGKGPLFDREGRRLAGLSEEFINQVEVFSHSRGRPPKVFWFNPVCEQEVGVQSRAINHPKHFQELTKDLAPLMMHLGHSDDVVLIAKELSLCWLKKVKDSGFEIPEFIVGAEDPKKILGERHLGGLCPWGWSPSASHALAPLKDFLVSGTTSPPVDVWKNNRDGSNIFSKVAAVSLRSEQDLHGHVCGSLDQIEQTLLSIKQKCVIKAPIGSSGHNAIQTDGSLDEKYKSWCQKILKSQSQVVIEPWVKRIADLSCQIEITPAGEVKILGFTRFIVNSHGTYKGHLFGKLLDGLPPELHVRWHESSGWAERFAESALRVGRYLFNQGYHGPTGIDGFIYQTSDKVLFQSLGEINPRYTMGRVALELSKHLVSKQPGVWLHLSKKELQHTGFDNFKSFAKHLELNAPLKLRKHSSGPIQLESGALCTNDPDKATQMLTILFAGATLAEVQVLLKHTS